MKPIDSSLNDSAVGHDASRRSFLQTLGAVPAIGAASSLNHKMAVLSQRYADPFANLLRSENGRRLSHARYHRAESFFLPMASGRPIAQSDMLYHAGIVAQLALSSHLLDMGFPDEWCARWISLRVAKALEYANATGLGHIDAEMERLAVVLTPYWVWRQPTGRGGTAPDNGSFTIDQVRPLLRTLLDRVRNVTGHPRPRGRQRLQGEARA